MKPDTSKTLPAAGVAGCAARRIGVEVLLDYQVSASADILLRIGVGQAPGQTVETHGYESEMPLTIRDAPSSLAWASADQGFRCAYRAEVTIDRSRAEFSTLAATPVQTLPDDIICYLTASRYCPSDEFGRFAANEFAGTVGGARIVAIREYVATHLEYVAGTSNAHTTALDTFVARAGVCRDFAHLVITLARASSIPARIASVYAPQVTPQDFHAVAEVYLDGAWHFVDATGMAEPDQIAKICDGRDAADVAFLTSFGGAATMIEQTVSVTELKG